jgi:hypothetical protein
VSEAEEQMRREIEPSKREKAGKRERATHLLPLENPV